MNKTWIIIFIIFVLTGIILTVLFLTKKKSCPGDGTCSGHGTCDTKSGKCNCDPKYTGDYCDTVSCDCSGVGTCDETGKCKCPVNYDGTKCEKCKDGWSGDGCTIKKCTDCSGNGTCDTDGKCTCKTDRWRGDNCELCGGVWSGAPTCTVCGCGKGGTCNEDGSCKCKSNYNGSLCDICLCEHGGQCTDDGKCDCGDNSFWTGDRCEEKIYVAVGKSTVPKDVITWSVDGKTGWTGVAPDGWALNAITWNGEIFVAVGSGSNGLSILFSEKNKINEWTVLYQQIFLFGNGITWNGEIFVAVGNAGSNAGNSIAWSADGKTRWTGSNNIFKNIVYGITWSITQKIFVAVGDGTGTTPSIAWSTDGKTHWENGSNELDNFIFYSIANNTNGFVAVGKQDGAAVNTIAWSVNGKTNWTISDTGFTKFTSGQEPIGYGVACSDKIFVAVGYGKDRILVSNDNGKSWTPSKNGNDSFSGVSGYGKGVTWTGNIFIAVGYGNCSTAWSDNGSDWYKSDETNFSTVNNGVI